MQALGINIIKIFDYFPLRSELGISERIYLTRLNFLLICRQVNLLLSQKYSRRQVNTFCIIVCNKQTYSFRGASIDWEVSCGGGCTRAADLTWREHRFQSASRRAAGRTCAPRLPSQNTGCVTRAQNSTYYPRRCKLQVYISAVLKWTRPLANWELRLSLRQLMRYVQEQPCAWREDLTTFSASN